jgi:hypothetical protein
MRSKNLFFVHKIKSVFALFVAFVLFLSIQITAQDTERAEISKIIEAVSEDSQKGAIFSYSYLMKVSYEKHKFGGRKFTRLYEAIIPSRFSLNRIYAHPFILLKDSEKTVSEDAIRNMRKIIAKEIERAESEEEKKLKDDEKPPQDGGYWTMGFSASSQRVEVNVISLLKNSFLSNLQRKQVDGRSVVTLEFEPNPAASLDKPLSYLSKIEGQIWIDELDKRITRIEGYPRGEFVKQKDKPEMERLKEAVFLFSQTKVSEGFWFPQNVWLNFEKHPEIFESIEVEFSFSEYKKGTVDVQYQEEKPKEAGGAK